MSEAEAKQPYSTYRELRKLRAQLAGFPYIGGDPDLLFDGDGKVRLPKFTAIAISWAERGNGCLTRQPTQDRAAAVMDALRDRVAARGMGMEIRPGRVSESFGVYLTA